jgi:hypothetical protein
MAGENHIGAPVFLPPEILGGIFLHCRELVYQRQQTARCFWHWAVVSHVCSYWRAVALDLPTLWSGIFLDDPDMLAIAPIALERSKAVSLAVRMLLMDAQCPDDTLLSQMILGEMHRVSSLELWMQNVDGLAQHSIAGSLIQPAPKIRHALIRCSGMWSPPPVLFGGEAPELRTLGLVGMDFRWNLRATNLRTLQIRETQSKVTSSRIASALRTMPYLEDLALCGLQCEMSELAPPLGEGSSIALDALRKLHIEGVSVELLADILPLVRAPSLAYVSLSAKLPTADEGMFSRIVPHLSSLARLPASDVDVDRMTFVAHGSCLEFVYSTTGESRVKLDMSLMWHITHGAVPEILSRLVLGWTPLRNRSQSLACCVSHDFEAREVGDWLSHPAFARVRALELKEDLCAISRALSPTQGRTPLPQLSTITARYVNLMGKCSFCSRGASVPYALTLKDSLKGRPNVGVGMNELQLFNCDISEEAIALLHNI